MSSSPENSSRSPWWALFAVALLGVAAAFGIAKFKPKPEVLRYSLPEKSTWWIAPQMLAARWGLFAEQNIAPDETFWPTGKRALQSLLEDESDMAYVAGPPLVKAVLDGKPLLVLGRTMSSSGIIHLLPNKEYVDTWFQHPIGLARGTISEFYLIAHLKQMGRLDLYRDNKLKLIDRPNVEGNFISLVQDQTKTIVLFEPFASLTTKGPDSNALVTEITDPKVYTVYCYYVTTPEKWARKRDLILRALTALKTSSDRTMKTPQQAWEDVKPMLEYSEQAEVWGRRDWKNVDFTFITSEKIVREGLEQDSNLGFEGGFYSKRADLAPALSILNEVDRRLAAK